MFHLSPFLPKLYTVNKLIMSVIKIADLYIRVSTDEQKEKGYSQRDQEDRLRKYCEINKIKINNIYVEDCSAKTFDRPQWKLFLSTLKKKGTVLASQMLFTKWDRFSRNTSDAYQMIDMLRKSGIQPLAIEQPLDLSIPENKMMLAFYLAAPEVENDRRSLNVFYGMRRAKKEGRVMGIAPIGYQNKLSPSGEKYIAPHPLFAPIMREAFHELAGGKYTVRDIWRRACRKGLVSSRNPFWIAMRNPVYCGKVFIPQHMDEDAHFVDGKHQALISVETFYQAQDILEGRKPRHIMGSGVPEEIPLRGLMKCPCCGGNVTGSQSKGKLRWYYYYHCVHPCKFRVNAAKANEIFEKSLEKYKPLEGMQELYRRVIANEYETSLKGRGKKKQGTQLEIEALKLKLTKVRDLLMADEISPDDYREMKNGLEKKILELERTLQKYEEKQLGISNLITNLSNTLVDIDKAYFEAKVDLKREIVAAIFPEKLVFENEKFRTPKLNEGADIIYQITNQLRQIKNETISVFPELSRLVHL